ncbi:hypothetical protein BM613_07275 [Sulfoacidibacillus thermotolerans]|uniref:Uncharacterized protein n=1 Tax=Sulfoacidibacillus thermotolerans TaxID=1765684 RepID=A0A2U3D924_SULT2|nr:hypothetical protein BM613_07275 [Sulfoacidibacillus thermotolerans]
MIASIWGIETNDWRERVGIEPTGDAPRRPLGFEDREGHQYPIRSHREKGCTAMTLQQTGCSITKVASEMQLIDSTFV